MTSIMLRHFLRKGHVENSCKKLPCLQNWIQSHL